MRIIPLPKNATSQQIAEHNRVTAQFHQMLVDMEEDDKQRAAEKIERLEWAKQHLKKLGIDHLVDL